MEIHAFLTLFPGVSGVGSAIAGWLTSACATCACKAGGCAGAGSFGAGTAGSGAAAGGDIGPKKIFPLPGGGWFGTDGRAHYGTSGSVGIFSGEASADAGAAPGSDPRGPIVDVNWSVSGSVAGVDVGSKSGNVSVSISKPVQDRVSSHYGGMGTQSGAWLNQFMNSD